jgi:hypothetical protein
MTDSIIAIAQTLSTGGNQIAVLAFVLLIMLGGVLIVVLRMFSSFIDFKKEMYKSGNLPDRGKRGQRY